MANYMTAKKAQTDLVFGESETYPGEFKTPVASLPAGAVPYRAGSRNAPPWNREAAGSFKPEQFGLDDYYDPSYCVSLDFNPNQLSVSELKRLGINLFSPGVLTTAEFAALPQQNKEIYGYESSLHGVYEGARYYEAPLAELEAQYFKSIPGGLHHWCANIETSTEWNQWRYELQTGHGYDSWAVAQNRSILCELDGQTRTLGQLWASGLWDAEARLRRANRLAIMMIIARFRNTYCAHGSAMHQGEPRTDSLTNRSLFIEGVADVSRIGGVNGTITLNGRQYTGVNKSVYAYENSHLDYYYYAGCEIPSPLRIEVWVQKKPGTQSMEYIWANQPEYYIVAAEMGHWQANRAKMRNIAGQAIRGQRRMFELNFESDLHDENDTPFPAFVPFAEFQNVNFFGQYTLTKKLYLPPIWVHAIATINRFMEGGTPGAGLRMFNDNDKARLPVSHPWWQHVLHTATAVFQARKEMQPLERFLAVSTLVESMAIQIGQVGSYQVISGAEAFGFGPDGSRYPPKPTWAGRWLAVSGGYQVSLCGGFVQSDTTERVDNIKFPDGECNGAVFTVKTRGYGVHVRNFFVPATDTNQTYTASYAATPAYEKRGYAGRITA